MDGQLYKVSITASGEVRDADGNLVSSTPVEAVMEMTADELKRMMGDQSWQ